MGAIARIAQDVPVLFPVHPRTRPSVTRSTRAAALVSASRLRLLEPLGYHEFIGLMDESAAVLTDSGGAQEESTALGVPCLTLRENTERPVTVTARHEPHRRLRPRAHRRGVARHPGRQPPGEPSSALGRQRRAPHRRRLRRRAQLNVDAAHRSLDSRLDHDGRTASHRAAGGYAASAGVDAADHCRHRGVRLRPDRPRRPRRSGRSGRPSRWRAGSGRIDRASRISPIDGRTRALFRPVARRLRARRRGAAAPARRDPAGSRPGNALLRLRVGRGCRADRGRPARRAAAIRLPDSQGAAPERGEVRRLVLSPRRQSDQSRRAGGLLGSDDRAADDRIGAADPERRPRQRADHLIDRTRGTDRSSVSRNRNNYYWKSAAFVMRKLRELADMGPAASKSARAPAAAATSVSTASACFASRAISRRCRSSVATSARRAREHVRRLHEADQWGLAWSLSKNPAPSTTLYRFTEEWPARGWSWADPFPVEADGDYHVFLEVYNHATRRGTIGVSRLSRDGVFEPPVTVLDAPYHLSYPFVFQWRGQWFLMPESSNAARIEVFAARRFPFDWTLEAVLFNPLRAVDSTLVEVEGGGGSSPTSAPHPEVRNYDELYAYHGPTPFGPWTPHRRNPDQVRCALGSGRGPVPLDGTHAVPARTGRQPSLWLGHRRSTVSTS